MARRIAPRAALADRCTGGRPVGRGRGPALPVESWHGPPTREEPSRHAASTEAGAQTPAGSGRGSGGPQGAAALARAVAMSRTPGAGSLLDSCASRLFGAGKWPREVSGPSRERGGRWQRQEGSEADGPGSNRIRPNPSQP